jgi:peptide/nickel transport system substrate-binding protein
MKKISAALAAVLLATTAGAALAATPKDALVIAATIDDITSLDPAEVFEFSGGDVMNNVYDTLLSIDPKALDKGYIPGIAESWSVSADGLTYVFKIRQGVKFHSGNPLTADDVVFSLMRAVKLNKTPAFILNQFGLTKETVDQKVRKTGPFEVTMTIDKPFAPSMVLNCMTATVTSVVDMKTAMANQKDGDFGYDWLKTRSAASGQYKLVNWKASDGYTLEKVDGHWGGNATVRRVIVRHVAETASQRLLLTKGDIDIARDLSPDDVDAVKKDANLKVEDDLKGRITYFSANMKHPILSKPEVTEAMKYLVDYDGLRSTILRGRAVVHQAFEPRTFLGAIDDAPYRLDVEKAKALLAKAGYPNGFNITMDVRSGYPITDVAQSVQANFAKAGIKMEIIPGDGRQTLTKYRARTHELYIGAWGPDYPDPHTNADTFARNPNNADDAKNAGFLTWRNAWAIPAMTARTDAAVIEKDNKKRAEMYGDIQREHQRTSPFVIIYQQLVQTGMRKNVTGFHSGGPVASAYYWTVKK